MPTQCLWSIVITLALLGCSATGQLDPGQTSKLQQLLPADAILLGEQHDAPDHQRIERLVVETLAARGILESLVLEMAVQDQSTKELAPDASEAAVRAALKWNALGWPWASYGPVIMAAVRAGVPVIGANLPAAQLRQAMTDTELEKLITPQALQAQQENIRRGHCGMLPERQILPMTRVQIARDLAMARNLMKAVAPGKTVVLLAGGGHVTRSLGIPQYLDDGFNAKSILLVGADQAPDTAHEAAAFDQFWLTRPAPVVDYCADFAAQRRTAASAPAATQNP